MIHNMCDVSQREQNCIVLKGHSLRTILPLQILSLCLIDISKVVFRPLLRTKRMYIFSKPSNLPLVSLFVGELIHHPRPKTIEFTVGLFRPAWATFQTHVISKY